MKDLADVAQVAAGLDHSLALKSDGTAVAWGWNYSLKGILETPPPHHSAQTETPVVASRSATTEHTAAP